MSLILVLFCSIMIFYFLYLDEEQTLNEFPIPPKANLHVSYTVLFLSSVLASTPWTQDVNWGHIRRLGDVQDVFPFFKTKYSINGGHKLNNLRPLFMKYFVLKRGRERGYLIIQHFVFTENQESNKLLCEISQENMCGGLYLNSLNAKVALQINWLVYMMVTLAFNELSKAVNPDFLVFFSYFSGTFMKF